MADFTKPGKKRKKLVAKEKKALPVDLFTGTSAEWDEDRKKAVARSIANMSVREAKENGIKLKDLRAARMWYTGSTKGGEVTEDATSVKKNVQKRKTGKTTTPETTRQGKIPAGGTTESGGVKAPAGYYFDGKTGKLTAIGSKQAPGAKPEPSTPKSRKAALRISKKSGRKMSGGEVIKGKPGSNEFNYNVIKKQSDEAQRRITAENEARREAERKAQTEREMAPAKAVAGVVKDVASWLTKSPEPKAVKEWTQAQQKAAAPSKAVLDYGKQMTAKVKVKKKAAAMRNKTGLGR